MINSWHCEGLYFFNDLLNRDGATVTFEDAKLQYEIVGAKYDYGCMVYSLLKS